MGFRSAMEPEDDMEVVSDVGSAGAAVREAVVSRPDVVLMDVRMPGVDGIQACRTLKDALPDTRGVMLTSYSEEEAVFASVMAGASGYLLKNACRAELLDAVRSAARGESLLDPSMVGVVLDRLRRLTAEEEDREVSSLSEREREVLACVARGLTNKENAAALVISEHTARNHVSHILDKLGLTRRSEAATFAAQHGLLDTEDRQGA